MCPNPSYLLITLYMLLQVRNSDMLLDRSDTIYIYIYIYICCWKYGAKYGGGGGN